MKNIVVESVGSLYTEVRSRLSGVTSGKLAAKGLRVACGLVSVCGSVGGARC